MNELKIKLGFGCLNCDKLIPNTEAIKGKMICSKKCLKELNKLTGDAYDMEDVWRQ